MSLKIRFARAALLVALLPVGGCSGLSRAVKGAGEGISSVLAVALYLAAIAAPFALSYWLYQRDTD